MPVPTHARPAAVAVAASAVGAMMPGAKAVYTLDMRDDSNPASSPVRPPIARPLGLEVVHAHKTAGTYLAAQAAPTSSTTTAVSRVAVTDHAVAAAVDAAPEHMA